MAKKTTPFAGLYLWTSDKKVRRLMNRMWHDWLVSKGDRLLTLNGEKCNEGTTVAIVVSVGFSLGDRRATRDCQRTFKVGKKTKVPTVVTDHFLEGGSVIEWKAFLVCDKCGVTDDSGLTPRTGSVLCDPHNWKEV